MPPDALSRFESSMVMDYMKWHDGEGYDLSAIDEMDDRQRQKAEQMILRKGVSDWRDLEALDRIGSPTALAAIVRARGSSDTELRLAAQGYGPTPVETTKEAAIVAALRAAEPFSGLTQALNAAADSPTPAVITTLIECVRDKPGTVAYNAAAILYFIKGKIKSLYGTENRDFFLRFSAGDSEDRRAAFKRLCEEIGT